MVVGDLNGDGELDLALSTFQDETASVLLSNADGTFQAPTTYAIGSRAYAIASGDLNGDDKPDLVVSNFDNSTVSVLLNSPPTLAGPTYTVDKNDAPTITSNGGGTTAAVSIAENTTAVTTVVAIDPDTGQNLGCSIAGGADGALFTINPSSGALAFAAAPNFEAPADSGANNVYDVIVQATDGNGATDTQAIAVTVDAGRAVRWHHPGSTGRRRMWSSTCDEQSPPGHVRT